MHKLYVIPLLLCGIFFFPICQAQTVLNSTGQTVQSAAYTIEYSVGEPVITTLTGTNNYATQGVLQPNVKVISPDCSMINGPFQYIPNPAYDKLRLVGQYNWIDAYQVFAPDGKMVRSASFYNNEIDISNLSSGIYFIRMLPGCNNNYKTLKIFKSPR